MRTQPGVSEPEATSESALLVARTAAFVEAFGRWMETNLADGLSYPRLRVLESLHCRGPGIMREVAAQIGLTPRNMTAAVDTLESEGLVVRRPHPSDRRATVIEFTPSGRREADTSISPRIEAVGVIFDDLSPKARVALLEALTVLTDGIRQRSLRV